tara:strand:- start:458 stop:760 length:303 start_codon:yes stop_codon:yes gene_type:complete
MSRIKMSGLLALPVKRTEGGIMPFLKDNNGEVMFVGDGYHVDACVIAINSHDTLTARVAELETEAIEKDELIQALRGTIRFCAVTISDLDSKIEALEAKS